ncbi:hypothetical protein ACLMAL_27870 [Nocardia sp. CWNU-33]|uniref:hypothetical protein n=1 Tax=Nocardia sp. CWNU-33 TaxID=3392117 RepID=UPI00398E93FC
MLIATVIVTVVTLVRRWLGRRTATTSTAGALSRSRRSSRWDTMRRPVAVLAAAVTLVGIAIAAGTLAQC